MPSPKDPLSTINPGPGKLPAGTVSASALLFPPGGGGDSGALQAHIQDPVDAHMASAIGVNAPLLVSGGGPFDGESVFDALNQLKDLFPLRPDRLGFDAVGTPNSGLPLWGTLTGAFVKGGAWTNGAAAVFSHFILANGTATPTPFAITYPADRGVLAVYKSTTGDFTNPGTTTLYAALWLGSTANQPAGLTCPSANFDESVRSTGQATYLASHSGLDRISLASRYPYMRDYSGVGSPFANYQSDFFAYQLALLALFMPTLSAGSYGSFLIVHWKESFAVSDFFITPASLASNFNAANVYSAAPPSSSYDTFPTDVAGLSSVSRRYVYEDGSSAAVAALSSWVQTQNASPSTITQSGVAFYDNSGSSLTWNVDLRVSGLVDNTWLPGKTASGALLPAAFVTTQDPIEFDFSDFGAAAQGLPYYFLRKTGLGSNYTNTAAPAIGDQVQYLNSVLTMPSPTPYTPIGGVARVKVHMNRPWSTALATQSLFWLFNSYPQTTGTASTATFEPFRDERYRYKLMSITSTLTVEPSGGNKYVSATALSINSPDAQVVGDQLRYPGVDYSGANYRPTGQPNYAAVLAGDTASHARAYVRAFNTGLPRSTGKIRIRGLALADFAASLVFAGDPVAEHPGGVVIQLLVPGVSGSLDLGRDRGDPSLDMTIDYTGCQTGVQVSGPDLIVSYDTSFVTSNNGAGEYPIFIAISFIKGAGTSKVIDEIEWLAP